MKRIIFLCSLMGFYQTLLGQYMSGAQHTLAGNTSSLSPGDGSLALNAEIQSTRYIYEDRFNGDLYFSDHSYNVLRKVNATTGIVSKVAGTYGISGYTGNGADANSATLSYPQAMVQDSKGNLYVVEKYNNCIRKISPTGIISHFAGQGPIVTFSWAAYFRPPSPDGSRADTAFLLSPDHMLIDRKDNIYVHANGIIYKIDTMGYITAIAGGSPYVKTLLSVWDVPSPKATELDLGWVCEMKLDTADRLYFSSSHGERSHNLWRMGDTGSLEHIFGFGESYKYIQSFALRPDGKIVYCLRSGPPFFVYDPILKMHNLFFGGGWNHNDGASAFDAYAYGTDLKYIKGYLCYAVGNRVRFIFDPGIRGFTAQYCKDALAQPLDVRGKNLVYVRHNTASSRDTFTTAPIPSTATIGYFQQSLGTYPSYTAYSVDTFFGRQRNSESLQVTVWIDNFAGPMLDFYSERGSNYICRSGKLKLNAVAGSFDYPATIQWYRDAAKVDTVSASWPQTKWIDTPGNWRVIATNKMGCTSEKSLMIQMDTSAIPTLSPTKSQICNGADILLTCHPGFVDFSFQWLHNGIPVTHSTLGGHLLTVKDSGSYTVAVTNKVGCIDTTVLSSVSFYPLTTAPTITYSKPNFYVPMGFMYYQWFFNGRPIVGANKNTLSSLSLGSYKVLVTDKNGCDLYSDPFELKEELSISLSNFGKDFVVSPNPSSGLFYIRGKLYSHYSVFNEWGQFLLSDKQESFDMSNYSAGVYFLNIVDLNGYTTIIKIIKH